MQISVLILTLIVSVIAMKNYEIDDEKLMSKVLVTIILDFYAAQSNTVSIRKVSLNQLDQTHNTIVRNIAAAFNKNLAVALHINDVDFSNGNNQFNNNIILIDSYKSFRLIYMNINAKSFDYSGYYTIVLTKFYDNPYEIIKNILEDCWEHKITNVNILVSRNANATGAVLYTYFPFTPFHCEKVLPIVWNYFENDQFVHSNKQLFPSKMEDLYQCSIKIATLEIRPYIFLQRIDTNNSYDVQGIDANIIYILAKKMNFKPLFLVPDDIPRRGIIYNNGTVTGTLGMVYERKANISIATLFYTPPRVSILTASKPYMYEQLVFVVPNPTPYSSFEILFIPFTLSTWITICTTFVIAVIVICIVKYHNTAYEIVVGSKNQSPHMNLIYIVLVGPTFKEPTKNFTRFLLIIWIFACFVLRTAYQADLFTFIKMNKMKESVRSIDELINQNISIKLIDELLIFLTFDKRIEKQLRVETNPNSYWNYVTENEAYVYPLSPLMYNATRSIYGNGINPQIKTLRIGTYPFVMYMPKHSCLTAEINDEIQYVKSSGLIEKWTTEYKETRFSRTDENVPRKLNMSQLIGIFQLCGWLLVVALILFIFEILSSSSILKQNCI